MTMFEIVFDAMFGIKELAIFHVAYTEF